MKSLIFTLLFAVLFAAESWAQKPCGTRTPAIIQDPSARLASATLPDTMVYLPVKPHIVRQDNGGGGLPLEKLNWALVTLNKDFLPMNVQFYLLEPNYIDNSSYYAFDQSEETIMAFFNDVNNAINVYIVNSLSIDGETGYCGYAYYPTSNASSNRIVLQSSCVYYEGKTFSHEMGHYLNLLHTFETDYGIEDIGGENCETAGDQVCDTPADPYPNSQITVNTADCTHDGGDLAGPGGFYTNAPIDNLMSYHPPACSKLFTAGQYLRMAGGLQIRLSQTSYTLDAPPANVKPDLSASLEGSRASLTWTGTSATGFVVERSFDKKNWEPIEALGPGASSCYDENMKSIRAHFYRIKSTDTESIYSEVETVYTDKIYCIPEYRHPCDVEAGIKRFVIETALDNDTEKDCHPEAYSNFDTLVIRAEKGQVFSYKIYPEHIEATAYYNPLQAKIWIDFDENGEFESHELVAAGTNDADIGRIEGSFTIPADAQSGEKRLRVKTAYHTETIESACSIQDIGETEDYTIRIAPDENGALAADFSVDEQYIFAGDTVFFQNLSSGPVFERAWSFDNGSPYIYYGDEPAVAYALPGRYDVTLTVKDSLGETESLVREQYINVFDELPEIAVQIGSDKTMAYANSPVQFEDLSDGEIVEWEWTFEGGSPAQSSEANPVVEYAAGGAYDVALKVTDGFGQTKSKTYPDYISIVGTLAADFVADRLVIHAGDVIVFTDASTGEVTAREWTFEGGDPEASSEKSPAVTFAAPGVYDVSLSVTDINDDGDVRTETDHVRVIENMEPAVTANRRKIYAGESVVFTDISAGEITGRTWTFEGGTPATSSAETVETTYPEPGSYRVTLTASDIIKDSTIELQDYIEVHPAVAAGFTAESRQVHAGERVQFQDTTKGAIVQWSWSFEGGDPEFSTAQHPTVVYDQPGAYNVALTVTDAAGNTFAVDRKKYIEAVAVLTGLKDPERDKINLYPNPFDTEVELSPLPAGSLVRIFNALGALIYQSDLIYDDKFTWKGADNKGRPAPEGAYLLQAIAPDFVKTWRIIKKR